MPMENSSGMRGSPCSPPSACALFPSIIVPRVTGRPTIRQPHKWQQCPGCRHPRQTAQHRSPVDMVVCPYSIDTEDGGGWIRVCCGPQHVTDAIRPRPRRQGTLKRRTLGFKDFAELFRQCPRHEPPERASCSDASHTTIRFGQRRQSGPHPGTGCCKQTTTTRTCLCCPACLSGVRMSNPPGPGEDPRGALFMLHGSVWLEIENLFRQWSSEGLRAPLLHLLECRVSARCQLLLSNTAGLGTLLLPGHTAQRP